MFRTELIPSPFPEQISLKSPVLLIGSCFTTHIGQNLQDFKFQVLTNPFGTIYNPHSLFQSVILSLMIDENIDENIVESQGIYRHWDFHSDISDVDKAVLINKVREQYKLTREFLNTTDWIIYTFGTAFVFKNKTTSKIVANCHKLPSRYFERSLLSINEIVNGFSQAYEAIKTIRPNTNFILTVSPVRHHRDSLELNSVSKSLLRIASHRITTKYKDVYYFPSYEIMMDDLRDYRFYKQDMLHLNDSAIDYIWQKFINTCIDEETRMFLEKWKKVLKSLNHKPFHPDTKEHKTFLKKIIDEVNRFSDIINVEKELIILRNQLKSLL